MEVFCLTEDCRAGERDNNCKEIKDSIEHWAELIYIFGIKIAYFDSSGIDCNLNKLFDVFVQVRDYMNFVNKSKANAAIRITTKLDENIMILRHDYSHDHLILRIYYNS